MEALTKPRIIKTSSLCQRRTIKELVYSRSSKKGSETAGAMAAAKIMRLAIEADGLSKLGVTPGGGGMVPTTCSDEFIFLFYFILGNLVVVEAELFVYLCRHSFRGHQRTRAKRVPSYTRCVTHRVSLNNVSSLQVSNHDS